jgi:hypothetical protein
MKLENPENILRISRRMFGTEYEIYTLEKRGT